MTPPPDQPETPDAGPRERIPGAGVRWTVLLVSVALAAVLFPFDGPVYDGVRGVGMKLGGDIVRELEAVQQFGGIGSIVIVGVVIWLLDPARRGRLADLVAAAVCTGLVTQALKMIVGRPRPKFDDPGMLLWPLGRYPIVNAEPPGVYHAWQVWEDISSDLWSMPSSHTSAAVALAVFLGVVYPRIRPLVVVLAAVVGVSRVLLGAHYPSDVLVGAGAGFFAAHWAVRGSVGRRVLGGAKGGTGG